MTEKLNIGIAGLGTVGVGAFEILRDRAAVLAARCGVELVVTAVSARDSGKDRGIDVAGCVWFDNARELAICDDVDVVVELIGGEDGVAFDVCKAALAAGKHVVTANKALMAKHGLELAKLAEDAGVALCCEAAVAGGIPILKALREGLVANEYQRILGIMNGTCNYILTAMDREDRNYDDVLAEAQSLGYAETPPDLDVDGIDAAHKLTIVRSLAYGCEPDFDAISARGIRDVRLADFALAGGLGYTIRLLAVTDALSGWVEPCLVPLGGTMAGILGAQNAVLVECDRLGPALLTGAGAGAGPTASAVIADIVDVAAGRAGHVFGVAAGELVAADAAGDLAVDPYYIRLRVADENGVLADITKTLSEAGVNVDKVLQLPDADDAQAHLAVITDPLTRQVADEVAAALAAKGYAKSEAHAMRVVDC